MDLSIPRIRPIFASRMGQQRLVWGIWFVMAAILVNRSASSALHADVDDAHHALDRRHAKSLARLALVRVGPTIVSLTRLIIYGMARLTRGRFPGCMWLSV